MMIIANGRKEDAFIVRIAIESSFLFYRILYYKIFEKMMQFYLLKRENESKKVRRRIS